MKHADNDLILNVKCLLKNLSGYVL